MAEVADILSDLFLIFKCLVFAIFYLLEQIVKLLIPSQYLKKSVRNSNVLITGAAGGLGKLMAKHFLKLGANLVCIDIDDSGLKSLEIELKKDFQNEKIFFYKIDITSSSMCKSVANTIKKEVGKIDILINNAGIVNQGKLFLELTEEDIKRIFGVNTFAHFWLCREFLPDMINENKGHIVNVSSVCGLNGGYRLTDYCASKFAVMGFTESLRVELKVSNPRNKIVVSAVCPFHVKTKMFEGADVMHLKWSNLSMEPEYAANAIVEGVLENRELIFIPRGFVYVFANIKYILPTKWTDYLQTCFDFGGSMTRMNKKN